jgi:hypothetical protein
LQQDLLLSLLKPPVRIMMAHPEEMKRSMILSLIKQFMGLDPGEIEAPAKIEAGRAQSLAFNEVASTGISYWLTHWTSLLRS